MRRRQFLVALLPAALSIPALAFERSFPEHAKRGVLAAAPFPQVLIDGKLRAMTPGGRIWSTGNLTVVPAELGAGPYPVNYTETDSGEIDRIWILRPDEAKQPLGQQRSSLFR